MVQVLENWDKIIAVLSLLGVGGLFLNKRTKNANIKKDEALAEQELVKVKQAEVDLTGSMQNVYAKFIEHFEERLEKQGKDILDLTQKYGEILLRNGILEERADTREKQYLALERDHTKLKADYKKLHEENKEIREENKEIRKELEEIKKTT